MSVLLVTSCAFLRIVGIILQDSFLLWLTKSSHLLSATAYVRGDPGFCLDHLSPSMSTFPTMYSDDITLDIISLALSSSLSLCRLVLCKVSLFTRIYKQPSDSIQGEERNPRYDRRRQHTVTPSLSLSKRIDVVEHRNERTHISYRSSFD